MVMIYITCGLLQQVPQPGVAAAGEGDQRHRAAGRLVARLAAPREAGRAAQRALLPARVVHAPRPVQGTQHEHYYGEVQQHHCRGEQENRTPRHVYWNLYT